MRRTVVLVAATLLITASISGTAAAAVIPTAIDGLTGDDDSHWRITDSHWQPPPRP